MLYLDHAATTPMRPGVWEAMSRFSGDAFGNASGSHAVSRRAKNALEDARELAASIIGARPGEVVFTGGGTESDNLAVKGAVLARTGSSGWLGPGGPEFLTVVTEHEAVLESARFLARFGFPTKLVGVDRFGRIEPEEVAEAMSDATGVVSVMAANNETGAMAPLAKIAAAVKDRNPAVSFHTDAVQAFVSEPVDVDDLGVDLLTLAAHKFGGPQGVGLLYVREGTRLEPVLHGGGQELGRRSGTHNVSGAVGMATAMELACADRPRFRTDIAEARRRFETALVGVAAPTVPVEDRLVQHSHLRFPGVSNETLLIKLDGLGLAASTASACQSGAATVSHVLTAMGYTDEEARQCLRFSFGWTTAAADGELAAELVKACL